MSAVSARADREIVTTRVIDAPRDLVFDVWTDPVHIGHWWGPNGFTTTIHEMDVRPGGVWRFIMHGPDGRDYHNKVVFIEVVRPERLIYRHSGEEDTAPVSFQSMVTFEDVDGRTRITLRAVFDTAEERNAIAEKYGAVEGGRQTIERLAEYAGAELARRRASGPGRTS